ncbi:UNVERIFIED_CONTAM: hypothetical protein Slati_1923600 [Sesamum latifolium]|uniref:Reverse transcriptase domain-containing protein n=1 Tax=Sesamum latifolium TaxID=2727402 RepID=A0AAW2X173_9LAMI
MPFGLKNTGATYQRLVDKIFRPQLGKNIEVYVDDMLMKNKEASSHVEDLEETFAVLRMYQLKLNLGKCVSGVNGGCFLGFMVTQRGIEANPANTNEAKIFEWDEECQRAFEELKTKVLNGAECRYPTIEKMALALVITAKQLRPYFLSHPVGVRTNTSLKQVLGKPEASDRIVKWEIELEEASEEELWLLHVNGSSTTSPQGEDMEFAKKFDFKASNNEAEYETLVLGKFKVERCKNGVKVCVSNKGSPRYPQANRQVEVTNRILVQDIKKGLDKVGGNWVEEVTSILWSYRTTPRGSTGESPFTLVYGT